MYPWSEKEKVDLLGIRDSRVVFLSLSVITSIFVTRPSSFFDYSGNFTHTPILIIRGGDCSDTFPPLPLENA